MIIYSLSSAMISYSCQNCDITTWKKEEVNCVHQCDREYKRVESSSVVVNKSYSKLKNHEQ